MSKSNDLFTAAERAVKALLLKSKDATIDVQIDTIRAVTAFIAVKHKVRPDKEDDDWLSDAQRKLRRDSGDDASDASTKPNGAKAKRGAGRDAYLAASRAADTASRGNGNGAEKHDGDGSVFIAPGVSASPPDDAQPNDEDDDPED